MARSKPTGRRAHSTSPSRRWRCIRCTLLDAGFVLAHLGEPMPTLDAITARPKLESDVRRPPFLLLMATRPA